MSREELEVKVAELEAEVKELRCVNKELADAVNKNID
jgi:hypothetical protein